MEVCRQQKIQSNHRKYRETQKRKPKTGYRGKGTADDETEHRNRRPTKERRQI